MSAGVVRAWRVERRSLVSLHRIDPLGDRFVGLWLPALVVSCPHCYRDQVSTVL